MPRDLNRVLDAVLAGMLVTDQSGVIELVNNAACRMVDESPDFLTGRTITDLFGQDHPLSELTRGVLETSRPAVLNDLRLIRKNQASSIELDIAVSPLLEDDGELHERPSGVVLMLRDRTIQKRLEALVSEREQLEVFGRIAAGIAHEAKNPLGGIRGAAEIVAARAEDPRSKRASEIIVNEVDRITKLIDDLMVFSRGSELDLEPINIHQILDDVLEVLAMDPLSNDVEIQRLYDPSLPELMADGARLKQVFHNLIRNALQAMERNSGDRNQGKALKISTRMALHSRVSTEKGTPRPTLLVSFRDNGDGIPEEIRENLGIPFFTTRPEGTGLGLAVSKQWIAHHGGSLRFEKVSGPGAQVVVYLPINAQTSGTATSLDQERSQ
ncbi:ATP-binding protein [Myxococcota bacterium]|nr:ATP-binding protein [Myxococcota bacterium]